MASIKTVRAIHRGFQVLEKLNAYNGANLCEFEKVVELPKSTLYRILKNLRDLGYVHFDERDNTYRLTNAVRRLSCGYEESAWVTDIASPILQHLGREVDFPVSVTTLSGAAMLVRETTDFQSPFTLDRYPAGTRLPLFSSASGRVYLSFCSENRREILLKLVSTSQDGHEGEHHILAEQKDFLEGLIKEIRRQGYAFSFRQKTRASGKTSVIAVPVMTEAGIFACLGMRYYDSVLSADEVVERFLGKLQRAARQLGESVQQAYGDRIEEVLSA